MTLRTAPLLLLAVVLGLVGCRDTLVDEPLPSNTQPPLADSTDQRSIYLKGPDELRVGVTGNFRAESLADAVEYRWSLTAGGTGQVTGTSSDPLYRLYEITGVGAGMVRLSVRVYDENNLVIGVGSKTVTVFR